jgi:hypothetical protein
MNKQQAMNWFDSNFNAGTVTRNIISEMFDDLEPVEPEKFMPTIGLTYRYSDHLDFSLYSDEVAVDHNVMYVTDSNLWHYCRPVPENARNKYGE